MLEIKHLTKIYKTKGGDDVKALDDVSIKFEETGLVFLLGKSGSGKSTLLNLAGGLDAPTEGEVIVMGKSSKEFSGSDFDSYRNTYVGFVFQEYNVLNEFNVEENVALALELQGKTRSREKVKAILEEVELENFAKRKPNTLSGGQKQRIAIARALVKDPQIIMADEPTGALDSATGKQVFDTLKNLSETRLVLVVSHDRDFAEEYGDRIVELKDGKIISDVTKTKETAASLGGRVKKIGENTLSVQGGAPDEETMRAIRAFLSDGSGEVILSKGEEENRNFKRANRIDENGARERFVKTDENAIAVKEYEQQKFIRSRLPARKALKIGASGLKLKPFRLTMTIFLSVVAFVMFGFLSTMMFYDGEEVLVNSFASGDYSYVQIEKDYESRVTYSYDGNTWTRRDQTQFTPAEIASFGESAIGTYTTWGNEPSNVRVKDGYRQYYQPRVYSIAHLPEGHPLRGTLIGSYPVEDNEVVVSSYLLECIENSMFSKAKPDGDNYVLGETKTIARAEDLIGEYLVGIVNNCTMKVTGVFESGDIPSSYDGLKNTSTNGYSSYQYNTYLQYSIHTLLLVSDNFSLTSDTEVRPDYFTYVSPTQLSVSDANGDHTSAFDCYYAAVYEDAKNKLPAYFLDGEEHTALAGDELLLPLRFLPAMYYEDVFPYPEYLEPDYPREPQWEDFVNEGAEDINQAYEEAHQAWVEECERLRMEANEEYTLACEEWEKRKQAYGSAMDLLVSGSLLDAETNEQLSREPTQEDFDAAIAVVMEFFEKQLPFSVHAVANADSVFLGDLKVVGFYYRGNSGYFSDDGIYCSSAFFERLREKPEYEEKVDTKYVLEEDAEYDRVFAAIPGDKEDIRTLMRQLNVLDEETDVIYIMNNSLYSSVDMANELVETLSQVFLWVGLVMALFAALLLFNFISMSISNKKKEIGILRAVGARGLDVFKIFFSESGIIVGICALLAIIGTFFGTMLLNNLLKSEAGLQVTLFVFGPLSVIVMLGVAAVVALIATFLPVWLAARKKPVESIRAL